MQGKRLEGVSQEREKMKRKYDEQLGQNIHDDGAEHAAERGITKRVHHVKIRNE